MAYAIVKRINHFDGEIHSIWQDKGNVEKEIAYLLADEITDKGEFELTEISSYFRIGTNNCSDRFVDKDSAQKYGEHIYGDAFNWAIEERRVEWFDLSDYDDGDDDKITYEDIRYVPNN